MPETKKEEPREKPPYQPPVGSTRTITWKSSRWLVTSEWITLRKREEPAGEIFHTYYRVAKPRGGRAITFVFNGGPGASSAYLHMGGLGRKRVAFGKDGRSAPPPTKLVDNDESWLPFTDLVFVDPIGTGFSRVLDTDSTEKDKLDPRKT